MRAVGFAQGVSRLRDNSYAAPIRVHDIHDLVDLAARLRVAMRPDDLWVAIVKKVPAIPQLAQDRVHCGEQGVRCEAGNRGRDVVVLDDELPLLRPHDR